MKSLLLTGTRLCLIAVLAVPLIVTNTLFFPMITGKAVFFTVLVLLALIFYILHLGFDRHPVLPKLTRVQGVLFVLLGVMAVASFFGIDPYESVLSDFERMEGLLTFLLLGIFAFLLPVAFQDRHAWRQYLYVALSVSVIVSIGAIGEYLEGEAANVLSIRVHTTLGNATFLGTYALLMIFCSGYAYMSTLRNTKHQYACVLVLLLNVVTLFLSGTRAAFLGLIGGCGVALFVYLFFREWEHKKRFMHAVFVLVLGVLLLLGSFSLFREQLSTVPVVSRLLLISPETLTEQPRFYIWKAAWNGFLERPILGWGLEQFPHVYTKYYSPETLNRFHDAIGEEWTDRVHNMYLEWLVSSGIVGLLSLLALFGVLFYELLRSSSLPLSERAILVGCVSGYLINNLFAFDSLSSYILLFSLIAYIHYNAEPLRVPIAVSLRSPYVRKGLVLTLCAGLFVLLVVLPSRMYTTAEQVIAFRRASAHPEIQRALFDELLYGAVYAPLHVQTALAEELKDMVRHNRGDTKTRDEMVELFVQHLRTKEKSDTFDAKSLTIFCDFMRNAGELKRAEAFCRNAVEKAPRTQRVLMMLGEVYREEKKYDASRDLYKQAFEGEPHYDPARNAYAAALVYTNEYDILKTLLEERYGTPYVHDVALIQAYVGANRFGDAKKSIEGYVKENPHDATYAYAYVYILAELGEKDEAIATLKELALHNPKTQDIAEQVIQRVISGQKREGIFKNGFPLQ